MKVKVIALKRIHKTEPDGELEVSSSVAKALVALGKARYAEAPLEETPKPAAPKPRGRPRREPTAGPIGVSTRVDAVGIAPTTPSEPIE
jgi:hypothetical protein